MRELPLTLAMAGMSVVAKAGDFQIMPDYRIPNWDVYQAYVVKDSNGTILASWSKPDFNTWSFHDPYNKIQVHVNSFGQVTDWTVN